MGMRDQKARRGKAARFGLVQLIKKRLRRLIKGRSRAQVQDLDVSGEFSPSAKKRGPRGAALSNASGSSFGYRLTVYGRIISLSSWSRMWQCQT